MENKSLESLITATENLAALLRSFAANLTETPWRRQAATEAIIASQEAIAQITAEMGIPPTSAGKMKVHEDPHPKLADLALFPSERDFPWGSGENDNYWNFCLWCEQPFRGHKRALMCRKCKEGAEPAPAPPTIVPASRAVIENKLLDALENDGVAAVLCTEVDLLLLIGALRHCAQEHLAGFEAAAGFADDLNALRLSAFDHTPL